MAASKYTFIKQTDENISNCVSDWLVVDSEDGPQKPKRHMTKTLHTLSLQRQIEIHSKMTTSSLCTGAI